MVMIPASCDACGLLFGTSNPIGGSNFTVTLIGNTINCPRCHNPYAKILDGVYSSFGDTFDILATSNYSREKLEALAKALDHARKRNATSEEVKATIKEHAPELSGIADALPKNTDQLYQFLIALCTLIIAVATLITLFREHGITEEQKKKIIDDASNKMIGTSGAASARPSPKSPRNRAQRRAQRSPRAKRRK
jgi:hypothetical protein